MPADETHIPPRSPFAGMARSYGMAALLSQCRPGGSPQFVARVQSLQIVLLGGCGTPRVRALL